MKMVLSEFLPNCLENDRMRLPKGFVLFWNKFYDVRYSCASASARKTFETALKALSPKQSCADERCCAMTKSRTSRMFCSKLNNSIFEPIAVHILPLCSGCAMFHVKQYISAKKVERLPLILFVVHAVFLYVLWGALITWESSRGRTVKAKMWSSQSDSKHITVQAQFCLK